MKPEIIVRDKQLNPIDILELKMGDWFSTERAPNWSSIGYITEDNTYTYLNGTRFPYNLSKKLNILKVYPLKVKIEVELI